MKKILITICGISFVLSVILAGSARLCPAAGPLQIDVLFMNHGPMQPTLQQMRDTFATYGNKLQVNWHDFESEDGAAFMARKGISSHIPLQIWLDDRDTQVIGSRKVRFLGFPTGAGPASFQGQWSLGDLGQALEALTSRP
jgi:hypothetical protein